MATELTSGLPPASNPPQDTSADSTLPLEQALEAQWIRAAQNGDQQAFTKLIRSHQDRIYSLSLRLLPSPEDAAEATQDVFVRAFQALPKYRAQALFSTWLYQITLNRCRDFWKRASSRLKSLTCSLASQEISLASPGPAPDHKADWHDALKQLDRALHTLPTRDREILILSCIENLSHQECATILRTSPRAIEGRLYRAREKLRKIWAPSFPAKSR